MPAEGGIPPLSYVCLESCRQIYSPTGVALRNLSCYVPGPTSGHGYALFCSEGECVRANTKVPVETLVCLGLNGTVGPNSFDSFPALRNLTIEAEGAAVAFSQSAVSSCSSDSQPLMALTVTAADVRTAAGALACANISTLTVTADSVDMAAGTMTGANIHTLRVAATTAITVDAGFFDGATITNVYVAITI